MELDNIKAAWQSLEKQLAKQNSIKESVLRELIHSKGDKALSRLSNYEWYSLVIIILVSPIIPYMLYASGHTFNTLSYILAILALCTILIGIGFQIWKIRILNKIDFSMEISNNVKQINNYNLFLKKEKVFLKMIFLLITLFIFSRTFMDNIALGVHHFFIYAVVIMIAFVMWQWIYGKFYLKNINSIQKSLDELKELEEEN